MSTESSSPESTTKKRRMNKHGAAGGGVYFMAFIGALVYYLQHAETFWMGVLGFLKACVWPALLVYKLLEFLGI